MSEAANGRREHVSNSSDERGLVAFHLLRTCLRLRCLLRTDQVAKPPLPSRWVRAADRISQVISTFGTIERVPAPTISSEILRLGLLMPANEPRD